MRSALFCLVALAACQVAPPSPQGSDVPEAAQVGAAIAPESGFVRAVAASVGDRAQAEFVEAAQLPLDLEAWAGSASQAVLDSVLRAQQTRCRVALDNIANADTVGFKRATVHVTNLSPETVSFPGGTIDRAGATAPEGIQLGRGVDVASVFPDFSEGVLESTDRCLDIAIRGQGMFAVLLPTGEEGFTRDGRLHLNRDGELVTTAGHRVMPVVTLPPDLLEINIGEEGRVTGRSAGSPDTTTTFGRLLLTRFANPSGLRAAGGGVWLTSDASGTPVQGAPGQNAAGRLCQGFVECSNVDLARETTTLREALATCRALRRFAHGGNP